MPTEHHLRTLRSARYFALGGDVAKPRDVWIACHGYGQLAAPFLEAFDPLADGRTTIVAPEALSRFYLEGGMHGPDSPVGASWMTREDRLTEIDDYVAYLDALAEAVLAPPPRRAARLTVLGFSQGTATASRWVLRGKTRPARLVLWGSLLPPDADLAAAAPILNGLELVLVAGLRDRFATAEALGRQRAALDAAGIRHRVVTFAGGHRLDDGVLRALAAS